MADEYISREAFKAEALRLSTHYLNEWDTLGVLAAVDRIPSADVQPVRHGRNIWDVVPGHCEFKCSLCGAELSTVYGGENDFGMDGGYLKYCPNCGAKMDGGET